MIRFIQKGDFKKLNNFLERIKDIVNRSQLDKYGIQGVEALSNATPKKTGKTSESWYYKINRKNDSLSISFYNSNINKGVPIAIILQYGHGTKNGGWVQGRDYINPAIQPIFDKIAEEAWKEVTRNE